jgi:phosphoribosylglycinamide formyltransferase 1
MNNSTQKASTISLISPNITTKLNNQGNLLKLGVMASGNGSNFHAIAQAIKDGKLNAEIQVLIYNNPDAYASVRADDWGIPKVLLNHRNYKNREEFDSQIVQTLREYNVKWVVMAGWMRLVTPVLIDAFPNQIINIHPSLLPSFKGVKAIEQALNAGVKITGCTAHLVCLEVDSGSILIQAAVPILADDTPDSLHRRLQVEEHRILPAAIALAAQIRRESNV